MSQPNLLFIFTDEQRYNTLAAYGNDRIQMPNLNRLASQSTVFDQTYVTQPVCTPSRSTLMTGLYPHTTGCIGNNVFLRPDIPCLPEMLPKGQYATGYHGKWHLGDEIFAQHGFDEWVSIEDDYNKYYRPGRDPGARSSYHQFLKEQGVEPIKNGIYTRSQAARLPEPLGKPAFLASQASRFLRENRDRPFALYVNFLEPHMPFFGPRDDQYDPADMPLPPNFHDVPGPDQPLKARAFARRYREATQSGVKLDSEAGWRRLIANYWGLCSLIDTHVGTILDTVEECGLADNTIVVFTSDHGDMMGAHQLLAKCVMYQEAMRVPLMIRLPGQRQGRRVNQQISQIDLVPTLLELMGHKAPTHLQGRSWAPALSGGAPAPARDVFVEWNGDGGGVISRSDRDVPKWLDELGPAERVLDSISASVRTVIDERGMKFNCSAIGEHELYDLAVDPYETKNLAHDSAMRPRMRELRERIVRWQERTGDAVKLPVP